MIAREHAEHFCPLNPNAEATTPSTAESRSQSACTIIESLPPISRIVRLIHICPLRGPHVYVESDFLRSGERDKARLWMFDERVAECGSRSGTEVDHAIRHAGLLQNFKELGGNGWRIARWLKNDCVSADDGGRRHARHNRERKIPWRNDRA